MAIANLYLDFCSFVVDTDIQSRLRCLSYNTSVDEQLLFQLDSPFLDLQSAVVAADILRTSLTSILLMVLMHGSDYTDAHGIIGTGT